MIGNISILICSFVFICVVSYYLFKIWPNIDVLDLYIIFVLFHFGVYPFVRGLHFGRDVILDLSDGNPIVIGLIFIHVLLILMVIKIIYRYFPYSFVECLKITNLIQKWSLINKFILFFMYAFLIFFQIFSYYKYGIKTYILPDDFARIGKDLPYWFTAIRTVYAPLTFLVCIGLISSLLKSQGYYKYIWLITTLAFLPVVLLYGRRFFLSCDHDLGDIMACGKKERCALNEIFSGWFIHGLGFFLMQQRLSSLSLRFPSGGASQSKKVKKPIHCGNQFQSHPGKFKRATWNLGI